MMSRLLLVVLLMLPMIVHAKEAAPTADDPSLEQRLMTLAAELRCLVCQNQSLADSHADLAIDLRNQVREQMKAGKTDDEIRTIEDLAPALTGWIAYFQPAEAKGIFEELDGWLRRRLRCLIWRQWKRPRIRAMHMMRRGLDQERAWLSAYNGHGPWWNAGASHMHDAFRASFFRSLGLISLLDRHRRLNRAP